jgi:phosphatidate cytidylyltransferase
VTESPEIIASAPPSSFGKLRFNLDWITRPVFGGALAAIAIAAIFAGKWPFAALVGVLSVAALREWHRIVESRGSAREFWISALAVPIALLLLAWRPHATAAWVVVIAGATCVFTSAAMRGARPLWHASGVFYVGVPALLLVSLRTSAAHAPFVLVELFLVIWATDTGALILGNLIGGPKLVPRLSPRKTWAGTLGGMVAASASAALFVAILHGHVWAAMALGSILSAIAHGGDLLESWVKRQFEFKDSGGLIPGHGGALDRIDSTLTTATAMAIAVFTFGLDPMFGAHP